MIELMMVLAAASPPAGNDYVGFETVNASCVGLAGEEDEVKLAIHLSGSETKRMAGFSFLTPGRGRIRATNIKLQKWEPVWAEGGSGRFWETYNFDAGSGSYRLELDRYQLEERTSIVFDLFKKDEISSHHRGQFAKGMCVNEPNSSNLPESISAAILTNTTSGSGKLGTGRLGSLMFFCRVMDRRLSYRFAKLDVSDIPSAPTGLSNVSVRLSWLSGRPQVVTPVFAASGVVLKFAYADQRVSAYVRFSEPTSKSRHGGSFVVDPEGFGWLTVAAGQHNARKATTSIDGDFVAKCGLVSSKTEKK